ncbi:MAG: TIGR03084 family metal-binding protein [Actinomycetota bacterium]
MDTAAYAGLLADLAAESQSVDAMLGGLDPAGWERPTPAAGWAIRDQASHLAYFDETATVAVTDPDRFRAEAAEVMTAGADFANVLAGRLRGMPAAELLAWVRSARAALLAAYAGLDPRARIPWYGPDMSVASSATARLMETWAHGQDIADALGVDREPAARLRHIAHLGVSTRGFTFALRGRPSPVEPVRVELAAPGGGTWTWGPDGAPDQVTGPAVDFCLVVTQRRNPADTSLTVSGPAATRWMAIAQAFAGPPSPGRPPSGGPA